MDDFHLQDLLSCPLNGGKMEEQGPPPRPYPTEPMVLGMAYVPNQEWGDLYEPEEALLQGTLFKNLRYPFEGKGGHLE